MASVRAATLEDVPSLVELGRVMHAESRYREVTFSVERATAHFAELIEFERGCCLAYERSGRIVGFFTGALTEPHFSEELMAFDFGLFLLPSHRGGIAAAALVKAFLAWAHEKKASFIDLGISTEVDITRTGALYERLGLRYVGALYSTMGR